MTTQLQFFLIAVAGRVNRHQQAVIEYLKEENRVLLKQLGGKSRRFYDALDVAQTAKLLGFAEHDIQVLMAARKLTPLGDPAPNAPKWFGAIEVIRLATDQDWLNKATKEVSKYWRHKRERRENPAYSGRKDRRRTCSTALEKVSPDYSPKSSLSERLAGDERAMASGE